MSEADQELARDLGLLEAYTIGLGTMIGAGIFVLPSIAAEAAGPESMISFALGGLISLMAALSLSELATGMPKAGGSYYYVNRALGSFFGSIVGWGMWAGLTFASAFYMLGFGQYLLPLLTPHVEFLAAMTGVGKTVAALGMAVLLTGVNYYGVKETGSLQNVIVITLLGLIVGFLGLGILSGPTIESFDPTSKMPAIAATIGTVYVSFIGFEVIATSAEEIKNPSRNLPLAMIAAVVTPTILYVGVMFVSTGTLSIEALSKSEIPVVIVAEEFLPGLLGGLPLLSPGLVAMIGGVVMIFGALLATVSSANASILSAARVNFAMGRDKILVEWLNEVHDRFRTPYRAISVTGVLMLVLIGIGVGIGTLAEVASFMYLLTYALVHLAVVVLRRADPEAYEPSFTMPSLLYPIVPIVGALACLGVLVQMSITQPFTIDLAGIQASYPVGPTPVGAIGTLMVIGSIGWYVAYANSRAPSISLVGDAIAPDARETTDIDDVYRVVVPVANPETERDLIEKAVASARAHDGDAEIVAVNVIEVPQQTSLSQDVTFEEERVERQRELLDAARDAASGFVGIRTRAIVGRDAGAAVLDVIEDEHADQVVLGWSGKRSRRDHVLGSTIDPIVGQASCDVTLVKEGPDPQNDVVVLVGQGPHTPVAVRRAAEYVAATEDASLTLLNVQAPGDDAAEPVAAGEALIDDCLAEADIPAVPTETRVVVDEDTETAIDDAVGEYDAICVGATRESAVSQALFGSLPERLASERAETVVIARGSEESPMSIRSAIARRLEG
ncbi:amino acid permease [Halococcoides cellulosivorans]|uniref:Amino acid transporter n=1 Tax=Halococcoides cellulosivorans TaxID=1679096 RepID=A0A2R4WZP5_9EURY|nr:amino acid permease [Halococcoides cellulosivorans]AWB27026.1 amino acid transporter [Halococcoides cellulosivorans]